VHSLQVKLSALVIALLVAACASLALIATEHERRALETEVEKRGLILTKNLASAAKNPLLAVEQGDIGGQLDLERLVEEFGVSEGVIAARLLNREGRIAASLATSERDDSGLLRTGASQEDVGDMRVERRASRILFAAPIWYSGVPHEEDRGVWLGEAQIELDLRVLVDPVVRNNRRQLTAAAVALLALCVFVGMIFVALLVNPLKRQAALMFRSSSARRNNRSRKACTLSSRVTAASPKFLFGDKNLGNQLQ